MEEITELEYKNALMLAHSMVEVATNLPLEEALVAARRSQAITPLLDPTLFLQNGQKLREDIEVMEAVLALKRLGLKALEGTPKT